MKSREWHERAAAFQDRHAVAQELESRYARVHGDVETATRAEGRAILARQRAKKQRRLAAEAERGQGRS